MTLPRSHARRPTLLIVGCGDVGMRVLRLLHPRWRVLALTSTPQRLDELRRAGAIPVIGNLDDGASLAALHRCVRVADAVLHLAPPPGQGSTDPRTSLLLRALSRAGHARRLVYGSTSGVYGDCAGALVNEAHAVAPATPRAQRRVDAEARVRHWGRLTGAVASVLRIPGIYSTDRPGGDPRERVRRSTPVLQPAEDVYTNHIHADDLARACVAALLRGAPQRVYHVSDNTELKMGDYFDLVADLFGMPRPPRISRAEAAVQLPAMALSFMGESRRLDNRRLQRELRVVLHHPTVKEGLQKAQAAPEQALPGSLFALGGP
jgi:nucleoside-diphosphate-sugar epimerase